MEQAIKHVNFKDANGREYTLAEGVDKRRVVLELTSGTSLQAIANPCDVHAAQTDSANWLQFDSLFLWWLSDDAAEQLAAFIRQYRHPVTPAA